MMFNNLTANMEKKNEDFASIKSKPMDRVAILQEARMFHDSRLSTKKCVYVLTKLLLLLNQGERLSTKEATDVFFAITKLFQCKDHTLRYIVYICIKELSCMASDVIIMTSSIIQDITSKDGYFRSQAIRALWKITDSSMIPSVERYMKQAIVDRSSIIASAALVSAFQLASSGSMDVVKRWSNEIMDASNHDNLLTQYHGLAVLCTIKQSDRIALVKLINNFIKSNSRSLYAQIFMIRVIFDVLKEEINSGNERVFDGPLYGYIEDCLHHRQEMIVIQAASCISHLRYLPSKKIMQLVSSMQILLSSQKSICRFASVRILNKIAETHSDAVAVCNLDLECFLRSSNRNLCTLAVTTLLKTSDESSVERLMQQITNFMSEITDEHRTAVVEAIRILCQKYPQKHHSLIKFLAAMLREDGGSDFKESVVDALSTAMKFSLSARTYGLAKLCEFIEDCEHEKLITKILYLLGSEGTRTGLSSQHIRYIYNRIILEAPAVRAAAVTALARIAATDHKSLNRILVLLKQSMLDLDDEVRDRAAFYHDILYEISTGQLIFENDDEEKFLKYINLVPYPRSSDVQIPNSENKFEDFWGDPIDNTIAGDVFEDCGDHSLHIEKRKLRILEKVQFIPGIENIGNLWKSNPAEELSASQDEYFVRCIKHIFTNVIVLEYKIENTLDDVVLCNVTVDIKIDEGEFELLKTVPAEVIRCHDMQSVYIVLSIPGQMSTCTGYIRSRMLFNVKDVDPKTGEADDPGPGYPDNFNVSDVEFVIGDFIVESEIREDELDDHLNEITDSYVLPYKTITDAITAVIKLFGLNIKDLSNEKNNLTKYEFQSAAIFKETLPFWIRAKFALAESVRGMNCVHMHLSVQSKSDELNDIITSSLC